MQSIEKIEDLENRLSCPTDAAINSLRVVKGDVIVLGAGGKMGPTLSRMIRRALDELGETNRKVFAVSRFDSPTSRHDLARHGIETIACDLRDRKAVEALPRAENVIFMAGQKFGTQVAPEQTWAMNTLVPAIVAEHFSTSRFVVFSTGCVYSTVPIKGPGAREDGELCPPGEYANSCVARERIFEYFSQKLAIPMLFFRLCYAIDLRYGVLCDVANRVSRGEPVDISAGAVNVIWQGDANARAIQSLERTSFPPQALNVTGREHISLRWLAQRFGELLDREAILTGTKRDHGWLWDASKSYELWGPPTVSLDEMIRATAQWIQHGGENIGKPTHFENCDGRF